ncbi:S-adenosyl-L-methionine-dependent methyltransferase [Trichodelitschia bisporula]|uniref:S-adenosyl-L-methionine-dependent methyltransferase n=1 Tax=Trichodelitschia bisporula TaxID=703511 RepID=A0A6G1HI31_9PEZI|nr:S-adenosyl-L-methionine-dependent methyltransferase [Trichodelitschia bisporula]
MAEEAVPEGYYETVEVHERTFQKYSIDRGVYPVPVDEEEEDRLSAQHAVFQELFGGRFYFVPLQYPRQVLDCGYGQAHWAVSFAQTYGSSEVTAIDIWPADIADEPDNLSLEVWNLNESLIPTYKPNHYDFIHSRCVGPGIHTDRWRGYVHELARLLKRDGWLQMAEFYYNIQSDSGRLTDQHALHQWGANYRAALERDRDPRVGRSLVEKLRQAGLREVQHRMFQVPIGAWPTDPTQRRIGELNLDNIKAMLESHAMWPFTSRLGWTREQVVWLTERAKQEAEDVTLRLYIPLLVDDIAVREDWN